MSWSAPFFRRFAPFGLLWLAASTPLLVYIGLYRSSAAALLGFVAQLLAACLLAAPEGLAVMAEAHPEVPVFTCAVDRGLDDHAYIRPGLGDAGDRLYGTL